MSDLPSFGQDLGEPDRPSNTVGRGVLKVFLWNVGHLILGFATISLGIGAILLTLFGLVELAYIIPLAVIAARKGNHEEKKGIIIAGSVGMLLTASCWGVLYMAFR
jgi:hypothetical protein